MKVIFAIIVSAVLSACEPAKTQDYYLRHPDEMAADLAACKETGKKTFNCNEADKAALQLGSKKKHE
jgi:hypothetical protein